MKFIERLTATTKGKTKHGVEFSVVDARRYGDVPEKVRNAAKAEGYKWHAPQEKKEMGYFWKAFATEEEVKEEVERLTAFFVKPKKANAKKEEPKAEPKKANAKKANAKKAEPKFDFSILKTLSPEEKQAIIEALFA